MTDKKDASMLFNLGTGKAEAMDEVEENRRLKKALAWRREAEQDRNKANEVLMALIFGGFFMALLAFVSLWAWHGFNLSLIQIADPRQRALLQFMMFDATSILAFWWGLRWWYNCFEPIQEEVIEACQIAKRIYRGAVEGGKAAAGDDL